MLDLPLFGWPTTANVGALLTRRLARDDEQPGVAGRVEATHPDPRVASGGERGRAGRALLDGEHEDRRGAAERRAELAEPVGEFRERRLPRLHEQRRRITRSRELGDQRRVALAAARAARDRAGELA